MKATKAINKPKESKPNKSGESKALYTSSLMATALLLLSSLTIAIFFISSWSWLEENLFALISMTLLLGALLFLSSTYESIGRLYFDRKLFVYHSIGSMSQVVIILVGIAFGVSQFIGAHSAHGAGISSLSIYNGIIGSLSYGNTIALIYFCSFVTMPFYALALVRLKKITSFRHFRTAGSIISAGSLLLTLGGITWLLDAVYPINLILVSLGGMIMAFGWFTALVTFRKANTYGYI